MISANSFEESAKILTDCGYEDMSEMSSKEIEDNLTKHKDDIYYELDRIAPDKEILDIFRMKYDYHNAKVIIKSGALRSNNDRLLVDSGRVSGKELKALFLEEKLSYMPGMLGKAMEEARNTLAHTGNPQNSDFVLDSYFMNEFLTEAEKSGNAFLIGYAKLLIDSENLKSAVRTKRMGKDTDFMKSVLVKGGNVDIDRLVQSSDKEGLTTLFAHTKLEKAAHLGAEAIDGASLTEFELECDNAINAYLKEAKLVSFGAEPLVAYLAALENEITAIRMILTGKLAGVKSETLKERLRDMYA